MLPSRSYMTAAYEFMISTIKGQSAVCSLDDSRNLGGAKVFFFLVGDLFLDERYHWKRC